MAENRQFWLARLCEVLVGLALKKQFGPLWGTERWLLYNAGLLRYPLWQLVPLWMQELARVGLQGGKDGWPVDVPTEDDFVAVAVGTGQTFWIKPGAYLDGDGDPRAEVRGGPMRTDLAILAALVPLEGGEVDTQRIWADYESLFVGGGSPSQDAPAHVGVNSERTLMLARALLEQRDPDVFGGMSETVRRERVVSIAKRIGKAQEAIRALGVDLESGSLRPSVQDAQRDVLAAELHDGKGLSWVEVGRYLHLPQTDADKAKNDNQRARAAGERGRELLRQARQHPG